MSALSDPRKATAFRFVRHEYADGEARLVYAFDDDAEMVERIGFPQAPPLSPERQSAFDAALALLHLIAGVSYYKAGVPGEIRVENGALDAATAGFLDEVYLHESGGLDAIGSQYRVSQGREVGRDGYIDVRVDRGSGDVEIGGQSITCIDGIMNLPST